MPRSRGATFVIAAVKVKLLIAAAATSAATAWSALWTFPAMLLSAFLVAWGAEAAQFLISQGLALAILAWLQTLPEFAVEAVIAWSAGQDPTWCFVASPPVGCHSHLAIANFTGAIRLLVGLGWPLIYCVAALVERRRGGRLRTIQLEKEHAVEVMATIAPVSYFYWVWWKGSIGLVDAAVLTTMYIGYLAVLWRFPPQREEGLSEVARPARWAYERRGAWRVITIAAFFVIGGVLMYFTAHPFLESLLAVAIPLGVSQFVFVQWVAPFVSEFPEGLTTVRWAATVHRAPVGLVNLLSSNVNQWTVLAAMIPIAFSVSRGAPTALPFDGAQRLEILLTLLQSTVAVLLLLDLRFHWWNAALLFLLWGAQFLVAEWRNEMVWVYGGWAVLLALHRCWRGARAPRILRDLLRSPRKKQGPA